MPYAKPEMSKWIRDERVSPSIYPTAAHVERARELKAALESGSRVLADPRSSIATRFAASTSPEQDQQSHKQPQSSPAQNILPSPVTASPSASPVTKPRKTHCPKCQGRKYKFTSYFHNPSIFSHPPHDIIDIVERSYGLKGKLVTLLVFSVFDRLMNGQDRDAVERQEEEPLVMSIARKKQREEEIEKWVAGIEELVGEVRRRMEELGVSVTRREEVEKGIVGVGNWLQSMVEKMGRHIDGKLRLDEGIKQAVLIKESTLEFKRVWENVWRATVGVDDVARLGY